MSTQGLGNRCHELARTLGCLLLLQLDLEQRSTTDLRQELRQALWNLTSRTVGQDERLYLGDRLGVGPAAS